MLLRCWQRTNFLLKKRYCFQIFLILQWKVSFLCCLAVMVNASITHFSFLCFYIPGNDLGVAFDIPQHVKNQPIFAACVLKVQHHCWRSQTNRRQFHMFITNICSFCYVSNRMQSWSSILAGKTLKMPRRAGLLPWIRRQRLTWSSPLRQVPGCNFVSEIIPRETFTEPKIILRLFKMNKVQDLHPCRHLH